jgi:hypothetical protein
MAALESEVARRGIAAVRRDCRAMIRAAWPHRHSSWRAPMVVRANVATLRDLQWLEVQS